MIAFINKRRSPPLPGDVKITYQDYNWALNEARNRHPAVDFSAPRAAPTFRCARDRDRIVPPEVSLSVHEHGCDCAPYFHRLACPPRRPASQDRKQGRYPQLRYCPRARPSRALAFPHRQSSGIWLWRGEDCRGDQDGFDCSGRPGSFQTNHRCGARARADDVEGRTRCHSADDQHQRVRR